jgi:dihydroorotate dehydrogenase
MGLPGALAPLRALLERRLTPRGGKPIEAFGLKFPNHVGLAAGFDKDGLGWRGAAALGFGHVEIGTVTPKAQPGNERPRVFRYPASKAVVNSYGFPNAGVEALHARLAGQPGRGPPRLPARHQPRQEQGHRRTSSAHEDYLLVLPAARAPGRLRRRQHQQPEHHRPARPAGPRPARDAASPPSPARTARVAGGPGALLLKVAPDLNPHQLADIVGVVGECGFAGIIATNTTVTRPRRHRAVLARPGRPQRRPAPRAFPARSCVSSSKEAGGRIPVVGCGGILSAKDAGRFMDEGACLVQVYSGLVFRGPDSPARRRRPARPPARPGLNR